MADKTTGIYGKFEVQRTDGDPRGKHRDCAYFVLDLTHDPLARPAAEAYAAAADEAGFHALAADLRRVARDASHETPEVPQEELRCACGGLLASATGVCSVCGADPLGYYDDDPGCITCGRDNRNGTHSALEATGHLSHPFRPATTEEKP